MKRIALAAGALAIVFAACRSDDGDGRVRPTPSPAATATAEPRPVATTVPPPAKPSALIDYGDAVAAYLNDEPAAAESCLEPLFAAWSMDGIDPAVSCRAGNIDSDDDADIVAAFSGASPEPRVPTLYAVIAFERDGAVWRVAYATPPDIFPKEILAAGDLIGAGQGALAYVTKDCGAHTCTDSVSIFAGDGTAFRALAPDEGIAMTTATYSFRNTNGDSAQELIGHGGTINSVGAGPQRARTDTYAYDGMLYSLVSSINDPPTYLYHAILDADALFVAEAYGDAEKAYVAAINDVALQEWMPERSGRKELTAYALYRAAVAVLLSGGDAERRTGYLERAVSEGAGTLNAQLAEAFLAAYRAKGDVSIACSAVREAIARSLNDHTAAWDFGYGNPAFDAATVCPF